MLFKKKVRRPLVKMQKVKVHRNVHLNPVALTTERMVHPNDVTKYLKKGYYEVK